MSAIWAALILGLACLATIGGCRSKSDPDSADPKAPAEAFTIDSPRPFPRSPEPATDRLKPGHWATVSTSLRSNRGDVRGELIADIETLRSGQFSDPTPGNRTFPPPESVQTDRTQSADRGILQSVRPVVMPRGQKRRFDFRLLTPGRSSMAESRVVIQNRLSIDSAATVGLGSGAIPTLASQQYFFVVLTGRAERFAKMRESDWVRPPSDPDEFRRQDQNYHFVFPQNEGVLPIADSLLDWTSTAVLWWDDVDPDSITDDQYVAIEDWLNFGGRLVVAGATGASQIARSPLSKYLPIEVAGNVELDNDAAQLLMSNWSVSDDPSQLKQVAVLRSEESRIAIDGPVHSTAKVVADTAGLVAERSCGRGTVSLVRFDVTSDWFADWSSADSFINAAVLGRPPRTYVPRDVNDLGEEFALYDLMYPTLNAMIPSALVNTNLRLLSRDSSLVPSSSSASSLPVVTESSEASETGFSYKNISGSIAAWNDRSDVVNISQQLLREESGIEIPGSDLIIRSLAIYLLVLVPLNYIIFRLLGRLEWAWLAVPVLAIGGAIWVARAARLDIGFARSLNSISVLEIPCQFERGHLCTVSAIYNSLSSEYETKFSSINAAAAPLANQIGRGEEDSGSALKFKTSFDLGPTMAGLQVDSNQVRMIHTEEMVDTGGPLDWDGERIVNRSDIEFLDAVIVRRNDGEFYATSLGTISPQAAVEVAMTVRPFAPVAKNLPMQIDRLMRSLVSPQSISEGECWLVGRTELQSNRRENEPSGDSNDDGSKSETSENRIVQFGTLQIDPLAGQFQSETVVVVHLSNPDVVEPRKDLKLKPQFNRN